MDPIILERIVEIVVLLVTSGVSWYWSKRQTRLEHEKSKMENDQLQLASIKELMQLQRDEYTEMLKLKDMKYDEILSVVSELQKEILELKEEISKKNTKSSVYVTKAKTCTNKTPDQVCPVLSND